MKRKLLALLLAVCLLAGLLPVTASAADVSSADRSAIDNLLSWYAWYGADYNCTAAAASYGGSWQGNLLMGVVCHPECVNFRLYPVTFRQNWSGRDPQGSWNSYSAIRASEAEWILRNIFHCTQADIARMRSALSAYRHVYYQDGYYYAQLLGVGDGFFTKNMRVYSYGKLWLIQYQLYADPSNSYLYTRYAVVGKSNVDGNDYWTLYYVGPDRPSDTGFLDVDDEDYYASSVSWALDEGITNGVSDYSFAPDQACTRAQAVTFLWRTAGTPTPKTARCPFRDVSPNAYYYEAMLWAVENGITNGTSATTFSPNAPCTRAQIVTFLYRAAGSPPVGNGGGSFYDVPRDSYYYSPVLWALANAITQGTDASHFSPNRTCTRAQMVTFLSRFSANAAFDPQPLPVGWLGAFRASTGERIEVTNVTARGLTLTHWVLIASGDGFVQNTFTLDFIDPDKTIVTRPYMTSMPNLEYVYTLKGDAIVLTESFTDREKVFYREN